MIFLHVTISNLPSYFVWCFSDLSMYMHDVFLLLVRLMCMQLWKLRCTLKYSYVLLKCTGLATPIIIDYILMLPFPTILYLHEWMKKCMKAINLSDFVKPCHCCWVSVRSLCNNSSVLDWIQPHWGTTRAMTWMDQRVPLWFQELWL